MIEVKEINMRYGEHIILQNVEFKVKKGDMISIIGKSGSGKSTILNILGLLDKAQTGRYFFEGRELLNNREKEKIRREKFAFVFQYNNLIPKLTVYENVILPLYYKKRGELSESKIDEILNEFSLLDKKNEFVENLSGGEQQRISFIRAICSEAEVLFLDEPTGNLDKDNTSIVVEMMKKINKNGKTIIVVTHDKYVSQSCNNQFKITDGVIQKA